MSSRISRVQSKHESKCGFLLPVIRKTDELADLFSAFKSLGMDVLLQILALCCGYVEMQGGATCSVSVYIFLVGLYWEIKL